MTTHAEAKAAYLQARADIEEPFHPNVLASAERFENILPVMAMLDMARQHALSLGWSELLAEDLVRRLML